jgi:hypothetical protein
VRAALVETDANLACRQLFANSGFSPVNAGWVLPDEAHPEVPAHIALTTQIEPAIGASPA